jgi:hypothetical protein
VRGQLAPLSIAYNLNKEILFSISGCGVGETLILKRENSSGLRNEIEPEVQPKRTCRAFKLTLIPFIFLLNLSIVPACTNITQNQALA